MFIWFFGNLIVLLDVISVLFGYFLSKLFKYVVFVSVIEFELDVGVILRLFMIIKVVNFFFIYIFCFYFISIILYFVKCLIILYIWKGIYFKNKKNMLKMSIF